MSNSLSIHKKMVAVAFAMLTLGAGLVAQSAPAEARKRHNNGDAALALGLFGVLAAGMLIAGSQPSYAYEGYESGYGNYGIQPVHYRHPRHYGRGFHPYHHRRHGVYSSYCHVETRYVQGRHGRIYTRQFRVCR